MRLKIIDLRNRRGSELLRARPERVRVSTARARVDHMPTRTDEDIINTLSSAAWNGSGRTRTVSRTN